MLDVNRVEMQHLDRRTHNQMYCGHCQTKLQILSFPLWTIAKHELSQ
jgi:hypothetical protein